MKKTLSVLMALGLLGPAVWADSYTIDPAHSSVGFRIKHIVGKVSGNFDQFTGTLNYDPSKPTLTSANATIQVGSVNTNNAKRDGHLKTADFFDAQKYPTMTFKSDRVMDVQGNKLKMIGELTMHGVTKPVTLDVDVAGLAKDPMGNGQRVGASATTTINRSDFNVGPSSGPMSGMIGSDVEIAIDIEGVSKK